MMPTHSDPVSRTRWRWVLLVLVLPGCGPPQVAPANRRIVLALATATSSRNLEWLEACAVQIEERRAAGALPDAERKVFEAILADARGGRWEAARAASYALRDAQKPTAEAVEAVRLRTLPEPVVLEPVSRRGRAR